MYRVMLIDDEPWSMVDIKKSIDFEALGMQVAAEYQDSISALVAATKQPPDILITDIRMPHMSGIEFIKRLRGEGVEAEVIIISGFQDFAIAREALSYGVRGYCIKPIDPEELTGMLRNAMARIKQRKAARPGAAYTDDMDTFDKLTGYMKTHYAEKLQLGKLAERFFLSPGHCSYLFAKRKNTTFSQYLQAIRLDAAKTMLRESSRPLSEVARLVGYQDYFYFSRVFKQSEGCSPKDYRKRAAEGEVD